MYSVALEFKMDSNAKKLCTIELPWHMENKNTIPRMYKDFLVHDAIQKDYPRYRIC
jgi:hypothetical protein